MADTTTPLRSDPQQNLTLLKIYTLYRVLISAALLAIFLFQPFENLVFGNLKPEVFFYAVCGYLALNLIALTVVLPKSRQLNHQQLFVNFFLDCVAIVILVDASGGSRGGLELLLVVTVAASSIMLPTQLALLIAALASLAILGDTVSLINQGISHTASLFSAGLVGITLFITAFFIQNLTARIRGTQALADERAVRVSRLLQLNQQIVQRMRTGIVVCNPQGEVLLANHSASELLGDPAIRNIADNTSHQIPAALMSQLQQWQASPHFHTPPFRSDDSGPELQASFTAINESGGNDTLIFLEDNRQLAQRAQQMKLASLGRLTASIAHEIRNPLGAISHAAQLLQESEQLNIADQRLCEIIQNHSVRMNKVIENVLQLSSRKAPNPEKINLEAWLRKFIQEFKYLGTGDWHIEMQTDADSYETSVDTSQLSQIITNLSQNGLRYSQQQTGRAELLFHVHAHTGTGLPVLDVIDYGPGISEEASRHVFEPFYITDPKGSGLGLYISRELCEANQARLDYIRTGQGNSCFRISFPHVRRRLYPE